MWARKPGFATMLLIILEQQVSLASAKAAYRKLESHMGEVKPAAFLRLTDVRLRKIGFSRQKTEYARVLARAVHDGSLKFGSLSRYPDGEVHHRLTNRCHGFGYLETAELRETGLAGYPHRGMISGRQHWRVQAG